MARVSPLQRKNIAASSRCISFSYDKEIICASPSLRPKEAKDKLQITQEKRMFGGIYRDVQHRLQRYIENKRSEKK